MVYGISKEAFVKNELFRLLRRIDNTVQYVDYVKTDVGEEYVNIHYYKGGKKSVCVTADSLLAMTKDVIRTIE